MFLFLWTLPLILIGEVKGLQRVLFTDDKLIAFRNFNISIVDSKMADLESQINRRLGTLSKPPGCPTPEGAELQLTPDMEWDCAITRSSDHSKSILRTELLQLKGLLQQIDSGFNPNVWNFEDLGDVYIESYPRYRKETAIAEKSWVKTILEAKKDAKALLKNDIGFIDLGSKFFLKLESALTGTSMDEEDPNSLPNDNMDMIIMNSQLSVIGWKISRVAQIVNDINTAILGGPDYLTPEMLDPIEVKDFISTSNTLLKPKQRKMAITQDTAYKSKLVTVGRTIKDKMLQLIFEFNTIPEDQPIGKVLAPFFEIDDEDMELFQTIMSIATPICSIAYAFYLRRLDAQQREQLTRTIRRLKSKITFLLADRRDRGGRLANFNTDQSDAEEEDNDEDYDDAEEEHEF